MSAVQQIVRGETCGLVLRTIICMKYMGQVVLPTLLLFLSQGAEHL